MYRASGPQLVQVGAGGRTREAFAVDLALRRQPGGWLERPHMIPRYNPPSCGGAEYFDAENSNFSLGRRKVFFCEKSDGAWFFLPADFFFCSSHPVCVSKNRKKSVWSCRDFFNDAGWDACVFFFLMNFSLWWKSVVSEMIWNGEYFLLG